MGLQRKRTVVADVENIFDIDTPSKPKKIKASEETFDKVLRLEDDGTKKMKKMKTRKVKLPKSEITDPALQAAEKVEKMVQKITEKDLTVKSDIKSDIKVKTNDASEPDHKPSGFFLDNALSMAGKRTAPWER